MGYYIEENSKGKPLSRIGKAQELISDGAVEVRAEWQLNLICVAENGYFDAAGYAFSEKEFQVFNTPDHRNKTWLVHPMAKELAGYKR